MSKLLRYAIFLLILDLSACTSIPQMDQDLVEVEGKVEAIGSMIEKSYLLSTADRNSYILDVSPEMAEEINAVYPQAVIVMGEVYLGEHVGIKRAFMKVSGWKVAE